MSHDNFKLIKFKIRPLEFVLIDDKIENKLWHSRKLLIVQRNISKVDVPLVTCVLGKNTVRIKEQTCVCSSILLKLTPYKTWFMLLVVASQTAMSIPCFSSNQEIKPPK